MNTPKYVAGSPELRLGDRIVTLNAQPVRPMRHDEFYQVFKAGFADSSRTEIELVVISGEVTDETEA